MRETITHAGDLLPRDLRPTLLHTLGESLDGFANDLELANDSVLTHSLGHEHVAAGRRVFLDVIDRVTDVTEVDAPSFTTRAIRLGCGREALDANWRRSTHRLPLRQFFEILAKPNDVQQRTVRIHVHEQIDVAVRAVFAARDGPEHTKVARAVSCRYPEDVVAFLLQVDAVSPIVIVDGGGPGNRYKGSRDVYGTAMRCILKGGRATALGQVSRRVTG